MTSSAPSQEEAATAATSGLVLFLAGRACLQLLLAVRRPTRRRVGLVSQLVIYPVKSCLGVPVAQAKVEESGLECQGVLDRSFAVVSASTGKCVSLKACPELSRVQPVLDATCPAGIRLAAADGSQPDQTVTVVSGRGGVVKFDMFGQAAYGRLCDPAVTEWLRRLCSRDDLLLVHCPEPSRQTISELRECQTLGLASPAFHEMPVSGDSRIAYANTAPLLLVTEVALETINKRLEGKPGVDWRNFRPNVVVSGPTRDREEESWTFLFIGDCVLAVLSPCTRCGITTVDYASPVASLRSDGEPLKTLSAYRKDGAFQKYSPVFGVNGFVEKGGQVSVGCEILA